MQNWAREKKGVLLSIQIPGSNRDNDQLLFYLLSSHMIDLSALLFSNDLQNDKMQMSIC